MEHAYFAGKKFRLVPAATAGALVFSYIKYFVHAGVKCICFEYVTKLVYNGKEYVMKTGGQGAITFAIEFIRIGPFIFFREFDPGRLIELGVYLYQLVWCAGPGLMTQQIYLGDDTDLMTLTGLYDLFCIGPGQGICIRQFGMAGELIPVVDEEEEGVDLAGGQLFVDEGDKGVYTGRFGSIYTKAANGQDAIDVLL